MVRVTDETVVEEAGIRVTKSFDSEGFPVPAVTFRVESDLTETATVRIVDTIPEGFGIEQIGFHPDYGSEHWTATGNGVVRFERPVEAGEAFTTVYGIRMDADEESDPFLGAPEVTVDPEALTEAEVEDVVPRESSEVVREFASGKRDTVPGLEPEEAAEATATVGEDGAEVSANDGAEILGGAESEPAGVAEREEPPTASEGDTADAVPAEAEAVDEEAEEPKPVADDAEEPAEEEPVVEASDDAADVTEDAEADAAIEEEYAEVDAEAAEASDAEGDVVEAEAESQPHAPTATLDAADVVAVLAEEIRNGTVDDDDLAVIREAVVSPAESEVVRLEHLQARVSDLEAYTDALEAFIDENGEAQTLLADIEADVAAVEGTIESIESRLETAQGERAALRERVDAIADDVAAVAESTDRIDRLEGDLEALDERVADAEEARLAVEDLREDVESVSADVEEFKQWRDQLSSLFG